MRKHDTAMLGWPGLALALLLGSVLQGTPATGSADTSAAVWPGVGFATVSAGALLKGSRVQTSVLLPLASLELKESVLAGNETKSVLCTVLDPRQSATLVDTSSTQTLTTTCGGHPALKAVLFLTIHSRMIYRRGWPLTIFIIVYMPMPCATQARKCTHGDALSSCSHYMVSRPGRGCVSCHA